MSDVLLVFLKSPRPGTVKTRLIPPLGEEAAAELYRALAEAEVGRTVPRGGEYRRLFFYTPPEDLAPMEAWFPGETWIPQEGEDLGARMAAAFEEAFQRGAHRAAIIGSDVPWVSRKTVLAALASLEDHDVVLGPSRDGGYYLLALDRPRPALFQGIPWSTPSVLATTAERVGGLGLSVRLLDPLRDLDDVEDLRAEWARLRPLLAGREPLLRAVEGALARRA